MLFVLSLEMDVQVRIGATNWHEASVMPAQAGIQGREGMDTGFRRYDKSTEQPCGPGRAAILYFVEERNLMDTSRVKFIAQTISTYQPVNECKLAVPARCFGWS